MNDRVLHTAARRGREAAAGIERAVEGMRSDEVEGLRGAHAVEGFILGIGSLQSFSK
jgi:hypothetical protein